MILTWFALFFCIFGVYGNEHQGIGRHPSLLDYKKVDPSLKIIHGKKTTMKKYPFAASLEISQSLFGAAVILNERWLLTTGFTVKWVEPENLQFRVGSTSYSNKGQVLKASQVIVHPNYNGSWDYDIAVVKTDKVIKFTKNKVGPIQMGTKDLTGGIKAFVAGWGMSGTEMSPSNVLLEGEVTVLDWKKCAKVYKSDLTTRLMCTSDNTVGPCVYDYGAPLVVNNLVYGLYAGGYNCVPGKDPVLYTDVPSLASWVKSVITDDEEDSN